MVAVPLAVPAAPPSVAAAPIPLPRPEFIDAAASHATASASPAIFLAVAALVGLLLAVAFVFRHLHIKRRKRKNQETILSDKVDAVIAALGGVDSKIGSLEAAVSINSTNIAAAAQAFLDNAAASVELAADQAKLDDATAAITGLSARLDTVNSKLAADDAALAAAQNPAPAAPADPAPSVAPAA